MDDKAVEEWGELVRLASPGHVACELRITALEQEIVALHEINAGLQTANDELTMLIKELMGSVRDNPLDPAAHGQAMREKPRQR